LIVVYLMPDGLVGIPRMIKSLWRRPEATDLDSSRSIEDGTSVS
jgi:hypothetical protein